MNMCANHPTSPAVAYCRTCGKPLCELCRLEYLGAIYCAEHLPASSGPAPGQTVNVPPLPTFETDPAWARGAGAGYAVPPVPVSPYTAPGNHASPAAALLLGAIPGVGAIYNGQYAKGLIHAVIFGLLITVVSNGSQSLAPLVGILIGVWWFYMVLEAYHTARKRRQGLPVDEFSSLVNPQSYRSGFPMGAVVLIALGMLLLLDSTGLIPLDRLIRYWPVGLILLGVYMLYRRMGRHPEPVPASGLNEELGNERR